MYHFIVNNTSGGGRSKRVWEELQNYLLEHEIRYKAHFTEYEGHAKKLADRVCDIDREKVYLIVVGGDGTLNEVLNGMHDFEKIRFGYIPTGSGNDFARGMKINGTPTENLERILQAEETTPIDLGCVSWVEEGQKELEVKEFSAKSGGGAVEAVVNGKKELVKLTISEEAVDPEDVEMLQDMIVAAVNEAMRKAEAEASQNMSRLTGGLNLGGLF